MYNLNDFYFLHLELTGYGWIAVVFLFIIYSFLMTNSNKIWKLIANKYDMIKKRRQVGFPLK